MKILYKGVEINYYFFKGCGQCSCEKCECENCACEEGVCENCSCQENCLSCEECSCEKCECEKFSCVPVLVLHGWGCEGKTMQPLCEGLGRRFLIVDFPPFGQSQECAGWTIFSYASMIMFLCESLNIQKVDILAHSFGTRVAILVAALRKSLVRSMVLMGVAGLKTRKSLKTKAKILAYKRRKKRGKNVDGFGSEDYRALSTPMRQVFVSVVGQLLDDYLPLITMPVLAIFGKNDTVTPPRLARRICKKVKNGKSVIVPRAGHFVFVDAQISCQKEISSFWQNVTRQVF